MNAHELIVELKKLGVFKIVYTSYYGHDEPDFYCATAEDVLGNDIALPRPLAHILEPLADKRISPTLQRKYHWHLETDRVVEVDLPIPHCDFGSVKAFEDPKLLLELAMANLERGEAFFKQYLDHPNVLPRLALSKNLNLPIQLLEPLLGDVDKNVDANLMEHPQATGLAERYKRMVRDAHQTKDLDQLPRDLERLSHSIA